MYRKTRRITVENLHRQLKETFASEDEALQKQINGSTTQFRNVMRGLEYRFGKINGHAFILDKPHIDTWLSRFLR
jgi:hypothetical protein